MYCGASLHIHTHRSRRYFRCNTRYVSDTACKGKFIPAAELEGIILLELKEMTRAQKTRVEEALRRCADSLDALDTQQ